MNDGALLRSGAHGRLEDRVVRDDDDVVLRDGHVHLERVDSLLDGVLEGGQGVFGTAGAGAAVAVDENARGLGGTHSETGKR